MSIWIAVLFAWAVAMSTVAWIWSIFAQIEIKRLRQEINALKQSKSRS